MNKEADGSDEAAEFAETDLRRVGSRIAERRIAKGWSQREVGRRTGMHPTRLSRIERGGVWPRLEELVALHDALGLGLDEMVFGAPFSAPVRELRELLETIPAEDREALLRLLRTLVTGYRRSREALKQADGGTSDAL